MYSILKELIWIKTFWELGFQIQTLYCEVSHVINKFDGIILELGNLHTAQMNRSVCKTHMGETEMECALTQPKDRN